MFTNRWLWPAIAASILLQVAVVHVGFLNVAFGTTALTWDQWLACVAMGSTVLWSSELRKLAWRLLAPETGTSQATGVGPAPDSALPQGRR